MMIANDATCRNITLESSIMLLELWIVLQESSIMLLENIYGTGFAHNHHLQSSFTIVKDLELMPLKNWMIL